METTKELRIGNLVEDHNGIRCEIYAIASNSVIVTGLFGSIQRTQRTLGICEIKPIPLTEEWMVKLGFRKRIVNKHNTNYLKRISIGNDINIVFYENRIMKYTSIENEHHEIYIGNANCVYVHQLQNLFFALTGKELA